MADELEEGEDERTIELSSVSAIYPEIVIDSSDPFSASIAICVELIKPLAITFPPGVDGAPSDVLTPPGLNLSEETHFLNTGFHVRHLTSDGLVDMVRDVYQLSHLPPLNLKIHLPDGYPTRRPPSFEIQTESSWMPEAKLEELRAAGHAIWEDLGRDQVVFSYIDFLREAAERGFDLEQDEGEELEMPNKLKIGLLDFDHRAIRMKFEQETFECGVCLEPKKGSICHRLQLCSHVFCIECLQDFFNSCITEGDVSNVKCMAPNCGSDPKSAPEMEQTRMGKRRRKVDRTLDPNELLQIPLEQETVQRYIYLKRKKQLESNRNTIYCPRQWCQGPARSTNTKSSYQDPESESEEESSKPPVYSLEADEDTLPPPHERLAICEDCTFAFCIVCKASWHGEFFICSQRRNGELTAEELASQDYMQTHTTPCPTCDVRCQKTSGCNHMICAKCNTHFCYLCSSWLNQGNPYGHFNTKESPCYQRLWELELGDGDDVGIGFAGGDPDGDNFPLLLFDPDEEDDEPAIPRGRRPRPPPPLPVVRRQYPAVAYAPPRAAPAGGVPAPLNRAERIQAGLQRIAPVARDARPPVQGLQHFLQMVQDDEEDEWDSDEMGDEEGLELADDWE